MPEPHQRIAVIGAGPIGLEAALAAADRGHDVRVFERGRVGRNVREWGFVRLFSPWKLNRSPLGARVLGGAAALPDGDAYPTGAELVEDYLEPLARTPQLAGRVEEHVRVVQVGRAAGKARMGSVARRRTPFRLLVEARGEERVVEADVVLDCSGSYDHPNWIGSGNIPAVGERGAVAEISYRLRDIAGRDRSSFTGRHVLLVGCGLSAATALDALCTVDDVSVTWVGRTGLRAPYTVLPDDPLPERARLARLGNRLATGADERIGYNPGTTVERVEMRHGGLEVTLARDGRARTLPFDRVLAHTGFSPDRTLYRELQVHECYATFGPMALAAALMADGASDCLAQSSHGPETLRNPEPDFFILGSKSYGKNSAFLIRVGLEQIADILGLVENESLSRGGTDTVPSPG